MSQPPRGRARGLFVPRGRGQARGWRGGAQSGARGGFSGRQHNERDILGGLGAKSVDVLDKRSLHFVGAGTTSNNDALEVFAPQDEEDVTIGEVAYVGSYNWTDARTPTIIVPGCPRIWTSPDVPYQLQSDIQIRGSSPTLIDNNGHRIPSSPLLPLFLAADYASTHSLSTTPVNWPDVDFVTDRNGLRKLVRWATGSAKGRDFRIDLDLVGRMTVLMKRWEEKTSVRPAPTYGAGFEQYATKEAEGCKDETGHHRIVSYDFGGLQMVVRFEVDACLPFSAKNIHTQPASPNHTEDADDIDALTASLASTSLTFNSSQSVTIRPGGSVPPQTHITELATRSIHGRNTSVDAAELVPQLVLSGTPNYFLAMHDNGYVERVRSLGSAEIKEKGEQGRVGEGMKRLKRVLEGVQERMVEQGIGARMSLVCRDGTVELYEREEGGGVVSEEVVKRFN